MNGNITNVNKLGALIKCKELYALMSNKLNPQRIKILDCTYPYKKALTNFKSNRIDNASLLDIMDFRNKRSPLTMEFPESDTFKLFMERLNISRNDWIVCYDSYGVVSSPRAWFIFKAYNFPNVAVLDGGLRKWVSEGLPMNKQELTEDEINSYSYFEKSEAIDEEIQREEYKYDKSMFETFEGVVRGGNIIFDTRPSSHFQMENIPGSLNVPFDSFMNQDKSLKSEEELKKIISLNKEDKVVTSCGIGLSACSAYFAVSEILGHKDVKLYNGSFEDYSNRIKA